ncbi:hypothetical protein C2S51_032299 [Perilla frutescens var. frutescens]|nr:hypothetical protein C2S51_032299 [Perilla frutescens var. frutescens]
MTKPRTRSGVKGSKVWKSTEDSDIDTAASVPKRRRTLVEDESDVEISGAHNGDKDLEVIRADDDQFIDELDSVDDEDLLEKVGIRDLDVRFPKLANRTSPAALVNAMASLTSKQRDEVNEMGFGQLFHLQIKKIPTRMAFWVLDNFDARRSEINIQDGRRLHIEAMDVHRVFGFPNGGVSIQRKKKFDTSLVQHKIMWEKNKNKHFSGPILFLTAFYVDRVVLYSRTVCQEFPTVKNWMHLLMKQRENSEIKSGGFGGGYPREAIIVMLRNNMLKADYGIKLPIDFKTDVEKEKDKDGCVDEFAEKFIQKAKLFAITMVELIAMVDSAPQHMAEPLQLKKIVDASLQLFGRGNYIESSSCQSSVQTQFIETQTDDEFWGKPEIIAMIEEIETAMNKRNDFIKNLPDGPSFSLGIT